VYLCIGRNSRSVNGRLFVERVVITAFQTPQVNESSRREKKLNTSIIGRVIM